MIYYEFGNKANNISVQENYYYMPTQQLQEPITDLAQSNKQKTKKNKFRHVE
jgi:hypothetical protein